MAADRAFAGKTLTTCWEKTERGEIELLSSEIEKSIDPYSAVEEILSGL
jgi:hypothetical protein